MPRRPTLIRAPALIQAPALIYFAHPLDPALIQTGAYSSPRRLFREIRYVNDRIMITGLVLPQNTTVPQNTTQVEYPWLI